MLDISVDGFMELSDYLGHICVQRFFALNLNIISKKIEIEIF